MRRPEAGSARRTRRVMTALVVGLTIAVALLTLLVAGLLRAHAVVLRTLHQMGVNPDPDAAPPAPAPGPRDMGQAGEQRSAP